MGKKTKKKFWTMPKTRKFKSFKKRQDNEYYLTEVQLNKEIKEFREIFNNLSYPLSVGEYDDMNSRRLKIKSSAASDVYKRQHYLLANMMI